MNNDYQDSQPMFAQDERQPQMIELYRQRQEIQRRRVPVPTRPEREPGDIRTWWGRRRESTALQQHHAQLDKVYYATRQAVTTQEAAMALEYHSVATAIQTVAAEEHELLKTDPDSLTSQVGQQLILDSVERIRTVSTEIQENFRRKALDL